MDDSDVQAARNLRAIWDEKRLEMHITQKEAAAALGITQSAFGQYLRGRVKIGMAFLMRVSRFLGVSPSEIRPEFQMPYVPSDNLDYETKQVLLGFSRLTNEQKKIILRALNSD